MNNGLLPPGFYDLLNPDAQKQENIVNCINNLYQNYGYELVTPPLVEFEETILQDNGKELEEQTFRMLDPISHKMLGFRSDLTVQISRIASTKFLKDESPLRLSYYGPVLRINNNDSNSLRQLLQTGLELIGSEDINSDLEIILVTIEALKSIGVEDLTIDFNLPCLTKEILLEEKLSDDERKKLVLALRNKNLNDIANFNCKNKKLLIKLADPALNIEKLKKLDLPKKVKNICNNLDKLILILSKKIPDLNVTIDLTETFESDYHDAIRFSIFSKNAKNEIGKGGRYKIKDSNSNYKSAVGATIYVNEILNLLPNIKEKDKILISPSTPSDEIKILQNEKNFITVFALSDKNIKSQAVKQNCKFYYENGKIHY